VDEEQSGVDGAALGVGSPDSRVLTIDEFGAYISEELELGAGNLQAGTRFVEDLDFDSVRVLELSIVIEELGIELDDADLEELTTLATAHAAYIKQAQLLLGQHGRIAHE
jgi:acyl carrier protein